MLSLLGFGCMIGTLFVIGVKLHAKNTLVKTGLNEATVAAIKPVFTTNQGQIKNSKLSSKSRPQSNYKNTDSGDNSEFYQVIIDNSLFRPLGWKPPNKEPEYTLLGTAFDPLGIHSKAYILERRSDKFNTVRIGDSVGDMVIEEIEEKKVILNKNGETISLRTKDIEFLKTGGSSSRSQNRSGNYESTNDNNGKSSVATKRTGYSNISKNNSISKANQKNLKTVIKNAGKEFKSLSKEEQKIAIEKKLKDMKLMKSTGTVTIEWSK